MAIVGSREHSSLEEAFQHAAKLSRRFGRRNKEVQVKLTPGTNLTVSSKLQVPKYVSLQGLLKEGGTRPIVTFENEGCLEIPWSKVGVHCSNIDFVVSGKFIAECALSSHAKYLNIDTCNFTSPEGEPSTLVVNVRKGVTRLNSVNLTRCRIACSSEEGSVNIADCKFSNLLAKETPSLNNAAIDSIGTINVTDCTIAEFDTGIRSKEELWMDYTNITARSLGVDANYIQVNNDSSISALYGCAVKLSTSPTKSRRSSYGEFTIANSQTGLLATSGDCDLTVHFKDVRQAVRVDGDSKVVLQRTNISADSDKGFAVEVLEEATFEMYGGVVANVSGGGVLAKGKSCVFNNVTMGCSGKCLAVDDSTVTVYNGCWEGGGDSEVISVVGKEATLVMNSVILKKGAVGASIQESRDVSFVDCTFQSYTDYGTRISNAKVEFMRCLWGRDKETDWESEESEEPTATEEELFEDSTAIECSSAQLDFLACSFVNEGKLQLELKGQNKLLLENCNFVCSKEEDISNDMETVLETGVKHGSVFIGNESSLEQCCSVLAERVNESWKKTFSSSGSDLKSLNAITSVYVAYTHVEEIRPLLLKELAQKPALGLYASVHETVLDLEELLDHWTSLAQVDLYYQALAGLVKMKNMVDDYGETYLKIHDSMIKSFPEAKVDQTLLLDASHRVCPLRAWFLLDGDEELRRKSGYVEFNVNETEKRNHSNWVWHWIRNRPDSTNLFASNWWCEQQLDKGNALEVIKVLKSADENDEALTLLKYEASTMVDARQSDIQVAPVPFKLEDVMDMALYQFPYEGPGPLPGFYRRRIEAAKSPEEVLEFLSTSKTKRSEQARFVFVACMAHYFVPDSVVGPKMVNIKEGEVCGICCSVELNPWNSMQLSRCASGHRYCLDCFATSMSTGQPSMFGLCPGSKDDEVPCDARASRGELEICGLGSDTVWNILNGMTSRFLNQVPGWIECTAPDCPFGGTSELLFGKCILCQDLNDVIAKALDTEGNEAKISPRSIEMRLLKGLEANEMPSGDGVFRECYYCGSAFEKGELCTYVTCWKCGEGFSFEYGPYGGMYNGAGITTQRYVPKVKAKLWSLGVYKDVNGKNLKRGQQLSEEQADEVVRRAQEKFEEYLQ